MYQQIRDAPPYLRRHLEFHFCHFCLHQSRLPKASPRAVYFQWHPWWKGWLGCRKDQGGGLLSTYGGQEILEYGLVCDRSAWNGNNVVLHVVHAKWLREKRKFYLTALSSPKTCWLARDYAISILMRGFQKQRHGWAVGLTGGSHDT